MGKEMKSKFEGKKKKKKGTKLERGQGKEL